MKIGHSIDSEGFYKGDVLSDSGITPDVTILCPDGFVLPKWDGTEWIEGGIVPTPVPQPPSTEERLAAAESALLSIMGL